MQRVVQPPRRRATGPFAFYRITKEFLFSLEHSPRNFGNDCFRACEHYSRIETRRFFEFELGSVLNYSNAFPRE